MLSSSILDTAIAIIFVFLLVSLIVTTLNEVVASLFVSRAKWLRVGINKLLTSEMADHFYAHALITSLSGDTGIFRRVLGGFAGRGPSYVPSRTFAITLLDIVSGRDQNIANTRNALHDLVHRVRADRQGIELLQAEIGKLGASIDSSTDIGKCIEADLQVVVDTLSRPKLGPLELAERLLAIAQDTGMRIPDEPKRALQRLIDGLISRGDEADLVKTAEYIGTIAASLSTESPDGGLALQKIVAMLQSPSRPPGEAIAQLREFVRGFGDRYVIDSIRALPDSPLRKSLSTLLNESEGDIAKLKELIEIWFNNAMDRVGGWYKRRTNLVILILAALVTVGLNVDTLVILQTLQSQASLRDAIVGKAKAFTEHSPPAGLEVAAAPPAARETATLPQAADTASPADLFDGPRFRSLRDQMDSLNLPIGWYKASSSANCQADPHAASAIECARAANHQLLPPPADDWRTWMDKLFESIKFHALGWLLTIFLTSLGAPFWFDTLNKFIGMRAVGKAPEEAQRPPKKVPAPLEPGQTPSEAQSQAAGTKM